MDTLFTAPVNEPLTDLIYESAFEPDRWEAVIDGIAAEAGALCGAVTAYRGGGAVVGWRLTGLCRDMVSLASKLRPETVNCRFDYFQANPVPGFFSFDEFFPSTLGEDPVAEFAGELGIAGRVGMMIPLANDELAVICIHKKTADGAFSHEQIAALNRYRSHLSRAALVSTRLGLERARAATATLNALGVPAAVLSASGRVRASNTLLDQVADIITPLAFGGMAVRHAPANKLFQAAVERAAGNHQAAVRSIPVPAPDGGAPFVLHLLPLRRSALDIFSGADALIAVTRVSATKRPPAPAVLMGLFDLTPAEGRLACSLAVGLSIKDAAADNGVRLSTARSYLDFIFRKTGTHRQSELVSLLNSTQPLG